MGSYEALRVLGAGGQAVVHEARKSGTTGSVALKRLHGADEASVRALSHEAELLSSIDHANVVSVLDVVSVDEGAPALVLEYVDGASLAELLLAEGMSLDVAARIAIDVLEGLDAAHEAVDASGEKLDIVHRDVCPKNILVGRDGVARITDFGIASSRISSSIIVEESSTQGKLGYMAPEQLEGRTDRRSDVYALGAVLFEMTTGTALRNPNAAPVETLISILHGIVAAPSSVKAEALPLEAVVLRALSRDASDRFATAREMAAAIAAVVTPASREKVAAFVASTFASDVVVSDILAACPASPTKSPRSQAASKSVSNAVVVFCLSRNISISSGATPSDTRVMPADTFATSSIITGLSMSSSPRAATRAGSSSIWSGTRRSPTLH